MYNAAMLPKELIAASTEPLILSLLAEGESYGYALIQRVRELSDGRIAWTDGMLYPVLHRLEREGPIRSRRKTADTGRKRKYYAILKPGRAALAQAQDEWRVVNAALTKLWRTSHAAT
jgi:PadR family transcriptional regulator PadR